MSALIQLELFRTPEEIEVESLRKTLDKVRKGTYARLNELAKENADLKSRLEILEKNICKGNI
jgi:hypothetical protein